MDSIGRIFFNLMLVTSLWKTTTPGWCASQRSSHAPSGDSYFLRKILFEAWLGLHPRYLSYSTLSGWIFFHDLFLDSKTVYILFRISISILIFNPSLFKIRPRLDSQHLRSHSSIVISDKIFHELHRRIFKRGRRTVNGRINLKVTHFQTSITFYFCDGAAFGESIRMASIYPINFYR